MLDALSAPAYRTTLGAVRGFASTIAELPPAQRADAIASAERYFPAVLRQFGYTDDDCNRWTSMIMRTLGQMVLEYSVCEPPRTHGRNGAEPIRAAHFIEK